MEVPKKPKPFSVLDKVLDWINVFSLLSVAVLMFVQVILRYVLKMPLMGIEELCYFPTVWLLELRDMITLYRTTPASLPVEKEGD